MMQAVLVISVCVLFNGRPSCVPVERVSFVTAQDCTVAADMIQKYTPRGVIAFCAPSPGKETKR